MIKKSLTIFAVVSAMALSGCKSSSGAASDARDGSSIEKAVKVSSIEKEYEFARKHCPDCQMKSQGLISKGSKHYDVLTLVTPGGEEVSYYFDITSFYGKW